MRCCPIGLLFGGYAREGIMRLIASLCAHDQQRGMTTILNAACSEDCPHGKKADTVSISCGRKATNSPRSCSFLVRWHLAFPWADTHGLPSSEECSKGMTLHAHSHSGRGLISRLST